MLEHQKEVLFGDDELIVSKTDLKGKIIYANDIFLKVSGYHQSEVLGQPHSMIRHEFMPRSIFHLLWETIQNKKEIFAYVVNKTKDGGYYWVLAHVTPSFNTNKEIIGFHSNRRAPERDLIHDHIIPLYEKLNTIEAASANKKEGMQNSINYLHEMVALKASSYHQFVLTMNKAVS